MMAGTDSSLKTREDHPPRPVESAVPLSVHVARNRSELSAAYELVYRQYVAKGYIAPRPGGIVYSPSFGLPTTRTVVAALDDVHVVGTWTMVGDNPHGLHLETTFPEEVRQLRQAGSHLAEVTCLCVEPEISISSREVLFELTKFAVHHSFLRGYDDVLLAVHPRHYPFYWRTLRATQISPCRPYAAVSGNPAVCCRINRATMKRTMCSSMREFYFDNVPPPSYYDGPPISQPDHEEFCRRLALWQHKSDNAARGLWPAA